ncbi:Oligopeptide transport ATP-binding protein AppF [Chlamydiales bacterium STE3]|nr:Oligopeptide transport ATP-binding protein AppF [Chlamydiales bacterium STE3]
MASRKARDTFMSNPLLKVISLEKFFPIFSGIFRKKVAEVKAVNNVSFHLNKGEVLAIVGESGSGKSTLGRASIRLIEPTKGDLYFRGKNLTEMNQRELFTIRPEMQMVFQNPLASLNPRKTIGKSIGDPLIYHNIVSGTSQLDEKVIEALEQVGLPAEAMDRYPHEFSGGQQQRICIGRAIAMQPELLICDEVVSALDVSVQSQILNLLNALKKQHGFSYLFISHDLGVVRHIADRVIVLYLGKVMEEAKAEDLFVNPKHPYTKALLSAMPKNHPKEKKDKMLLKGEIPSPLDPPSGCPFRTRCPFAQPECALPPPKKQQGNGHHYFCILD